MPDSDIQTIIATRKTATQQLDARAHELNGKINSISTAVAQAHRPMTADEKAAIAECDALLEEIDKVEKKLILVTNLALSSSPGVRALAKQIADVNAGLEKKTQEIKKVVEVVTKIGDTINQVSALVAQLSRLAAVIP